MLATSGGAVSGAQPVVASILAVLAAVAMGLVAVLRPRWSGTVLRDWTRARSVSEALKSEVYLYLAGAGGYAGPDSEDRLVKSTDAVLRDAADLLPHTTGVEPMLRELPDVHDHGSYFDVRAAGQIDGYYRLQARQMQRRLAQFRRLEIVLAAVGVVLGVLAARFPDRGLAAWIAVVTTITGAVAAHVAAGRYEYQLVEYLRTDDELERLHRAAARATSPAMLDDLVVQSERVISIQNEGWMAKLSTTSGVEPAS